MDLPLQQLPQQLVFPQITIKMVFVMTQTILLDAIMMGVIAVHLMKMPTGMSIVQVVNVFLFSLQQQQQQQQQLQQQLLLQVNTIFCNLNRV